jgi:hypothetical protein
VFKPTETLLALVTAFFAAVVYDKTKSPTLYALLEHETNFADSSSWTGEYPKSASGKYLIDGILECYNLNFWGFPEGTFVTMRMVVTNIEPNFNAPNNIPYIGIVDYGGTVNTTVGGTVEHKYYTLRQYNPSTKARFDLKVSARQHTIYEDSRYNSSLNNYGFYLLGLSAGFIKSTLGLPILHESDVPAFFAGDHTKALNYQTPKPKLDRAVLANNASAVLAPLAQLAPRTFISTDTLAQLAERMRLQVQAQPQLDTETYKQLLKATMTDVINKTKTEIVPIPNTGTGTGTNTETEVEVETEAGNWLIRIILNLIDYTGLLQRIINLLQTMTETVTMSVSLLLLWLRFLSLSVIN